MEYTEVFLAGTRLCEEFARSKQDMTINQYDDCFVIEAKIADQYLSDLAQRIFAISDKWKLLGEEDGEGKDLVGNLTEYSTVSAALNFIDFPPKGMEDAA